MIKRLRVGIILILFLTACSTNLLTSSPTSKIDSTDLEWAFTRADQHPEKMLIGVIAGAAASINDEVLMVIQHPDVAKSFTAEFKSMWEDTSKFQSIRPKIAASSSVPATATTSCSVKTIKGNPDSMIYHVEGQKYYDSLDQPKLFCTEAEAQAAGYRKSKV